MKLLSRCAATIIIPVFCIATVANADENYQYWKQEIPHKKRDCASSGGTWNNSSLSCDYSNNNSSDSGGMGIGGLILLGFGAAVIAAIAKSNSEKEKTPKNDYTPSKKTLPPQNYYTPPTVSGYTSYNDASTLPYNRGKIGIEINVSSGYNYPNNVKGIGTGYFATEVNSVEDLSCADGYIDTGDLIYSINGSVFKSKTEIQNIVGQYNPGITVKIEFFDKSKFWKNFYHMCKLS